MRYLIADDRAAAGRVAVQLRGWAGCDASSVGSEHSDGGGHALAYDWVWETLTAADRSSMEAKLDACGRAVRTVLESVGEG